MQQQLATKLKKSAAILFGRRPTIMLAQLVKPMAVAASSTARPCLAPLMSKRAFTSASSSLFARHTKTNYHTTTVAAAAASTTEVEEETFTYQAEVDRLMDMIVNSLYSNREVFLRELVSNASDALDKLRLMALQDGTQYSTGDALEIRIKADKDAGIIVIEDTGVGMSREELLSSLGTIARSGTAKFMEAVKDKGDANLIGQFGVGFYSAFLVAERVVVQTKSNADDKQWTWESTAGAHSYKLREDPSGDLQRGTRITLHLKEDAAELADTTKLSELIKQYSEFIAFPIKLWSSKQNPVQVVDVEATAKAQEEADAKAKAAEGAAEDASADPVTKVYKTEWESSEDWAVQNNNKPLWTRSPREVKPEEYNAFYMSTFKDFSNPLAVAHFKAEGTIEFASMLFVPGMAPFDEPDKAMMRSRSIRLYVKRVFISDEFDEDLMPRYLSFIKGVVDSADLPLNVSREILQESRVVRAIRKQLVKRSLDMIADIASRESTQEDGKVGDYTTFWEAFGRNIKLGVIEDAANRPALSKLLRFASSHSPTGVTSLEDYVARKKEGQSSIYYLAADSRAACETSPYVESLTRKGYEVLYLTEPIDEVAIQNLGEFDGAQLADVSREDLSLDESEEDKKALETRSVELRPLTEYMKKVLGDKVEKVVVSSRLTDSPAVVVASKFGWSANMEKIMRSQALGDARMAEMMKGRRIMEINGEHPIIKNMAAKVEMESREVKDQIALLFDAAVLMGGYPIEAPQDFANRIYGLMAGGDGAATPVDAEIV